jgi:hypothetical protein
MPEAKKRKPHLENELENRANTKGQEILEGFRRRLESMSGLKQGSSFLI